MEVEKGGGQREESNHDAGPVTVWAHCTGSSRARMVHPSHLGLGQDGWDFLCLRLSLIRPRRGVTLGEITTAGAIREAADS